jgi:hypothetical protein
MNWAFVELVNYIQLYYGVIGQREHYLFCSQCLPKGKQFNRYIKPKQNSNYEDWLVKIVGHHYSVSNREAEEYINLFLSTAKGRETLRYLLEQYGTEVKLLRKVFG